MLTMFKNIYIFFYTVVTQITMYYTYEKQNEKTAVRLITTVTKKR